VGSRWRTARRAAAAAPVEGAGRNVGRWPTMLMLAAALSLGSFAAGLTEAATNVCAGRCHGGQFSAYKKGTLYRMDFLMYCMYRAWSNDVNVSYAPANSCATGYVQIPYYLYYTSWSHPCFNYAAPGDLLWTLDPGGSYVGVYQFPCCDGLCYGV